MQRSLTHDPVGTARRRHALIALTVMAALLLPAAVAWACGPNRQMQCDRMSYAPGGQVSCSGVNFYENMDLSFRLDNGGPVGSVTTSSEGTFTFSFAAPSAPGAYTLVAEGFDESGNPRPGLPARQSFEVAAPAPARPAPGASPQAPTPGAVPTPGATPPAPGAGAPAPGTKAPRRPGTGRPNRGGDQGRSQSESPADSNGGRRGSPRSGNGGSALPALPMNANEEVIENAGRQVFADSVTRADRASVAPGGKSSPSSGSSGLAPGEASATGDLWSGFGSSAKPSLVPSANDPLAPEAADARGVTWGLALLGLGLLILMVTLGLAEASRRRALAR